MEEFIMRDPNDQGAYLLSMLFAMLILAFVIYGIFEIAQTNPQMFQSSGDSSSGDTFILLLLLSKILP